MQSAVDHDYEIQRFLLKIRTSHSMDRAGFFLLAKAGKDRALTYKCGMHLMVGPWVHV